MAKKILILTFLLLLLLSTSTAVTYVNANIQNDTAVIGNEQLIKQELPDYRPENKLVQKDDIEKNVAQTDITSIGKVEYTITEALEPIEVKINKRTIDPNKPMIAITYDDGPSKYTSEILNVLNENNSSATFFVLGSRVNSNKDILNQMLEDGNQIGNHSYNHKNLTTISDKELYKQIKGTDDLIYIATGYTPSVMRPPYGATNKELNNKIPKPIIKWSIDTRDWENRNAEFITRTILEDVKDGDIILMHDIYDSTAQASNIVIPELIKRGFQLVTVDELFEYRESTITAGEQYYNVYK